MIRILNRIPWGPRMLAMAGITATLVPAAAFASVAGLTTLAVGMLALAVAILVSLVLTGEDN